MAKGDRWNFAYGWHNMDKGFQLTGWEKPVKTRRKAMKKLRMTQPQYEWRSRKLWIEYRRK